MARRSPGHGSATTPGEAVMSMRSDWQQAKAEAEKVVQKGFFKGADLGPLLDKMEAAEKKIEKATDVKAGKKAKQEFQQAAQKAAEAAGTYRKMAEMASKSQDNSEEVRKAMTKVEQMLFAEIITPIANQRRKYKVT